MTFLENSALWPVDITGENIFLVKAVQKIGRSLLTANNRLPSCLYKYDMNLPNFSEASEDDKAVATDILMRSTSDEHVEIVEKAFYSERDENSVLIRNCLISETQWNKAIEIANFTKTICDDNILRATAITAAIFEGVATGNVRAKNWPIDTPVFDEIPASWFNTFDESVIKARLSLGQINKLYPLSTISRGLSYIFLDTKGLEKWISTAGKSILLISIARFIIMKQISNKPKGWKSSKLKEDWLSADTTQVKLDSVEQEKLWEKLPDYPFKIHGLRPNPS